MKKLGRRVGQRRFELRMPPANGLGDGLGDAEVDEHSAGKVLRDKYVGRFDVAVHDSTLMDVVQRVGDLRQRGQPVLSLGQHGRRCRRRPTPW